MAKIITDKQKVDEVLTRGVELIYPDRKTIENLLLSGKKIKLYCGYDPSAPALTIGNAVSLNKLGQFQKLGHQVIMVIGSFTGMIGDPTDKSATRKKLTREQVLKNAKDYTRQASAYLKFDGENPAMVVYNSDWLDKLTFKDLIELTSYFTVQQMLQRDMFQKRLKEERPIHLHEFLYPLAQAYDCVHLDVDLEIGGNDQMFNIMCGRDLMKAMKNKEKCVLTLKLLADDKGVKVGKTEGNAIFLTEPPKNMYGIIMSWVDGLLEPGFELCTNISAAELKEIKNQLKTGNANPRDLKMKLAYEITKINYGEEKAKEAQEHFIRTVQKKEIPEEIEEKKINAAKINIIDLLIESKLASSKSEARRLIAQKGVKIDGEVVNDANQEVEIKKEGTLIQKGKRNFIKVVN